MRRRTFAIVAVAVLTAVLVSPAARALKAPSIGWKTIKPASAPAWYTPELRQRIRAAGPLGVPLPPDAKIPVSSLAFLGIRPGQLIILTSADGSTISLCTANFVFASGGQFFIGTAGHCGAKGDSVDMVFLPNGIANIGSVVFSTGDAGVGNDFALISINPALNQWVSPSMAFWGGPTGAYTGTGPAVVEHTGWGLVVGTGGTPRVGLGTLWTPNEWVFDGVITPGDSGSGANVLGGPAAGNITHIFIGIDDDGAHLAAGTSIQKILQLVGGYQLQTCASAIPWPLPGCP
jgi:hypothetical protein